MPFKEVEFIQFTDMTLGYAIDRTVRDSGGEGGQ
jgi:hypothetical protein